MIKQELKRAVEQQVLKNKVKSEQVSVRATTNELNEINAFCESVSLSKSSLLTLAIDTAFIDYTNDDYQNDLSSAVDIDEQVDAFYKLADVEHVNSECEDAIRTLVDERKSKRSINKNEFVVIRVDEKHFEQLKLIAEKMQLSKSNVIMALLLMTVKTK